MIRFPLLLAIAVAVSSLTAFVAASPALAAESHSAGVAGGPAYIRMAPITISVIGTNNKVDRHVSVQLDLELEAGKTESAFEGYRRNILDAFLVTLKGLYDDDYPGEAVPMEALKEKLLGAANEVTGPGFVRQVLLISIGERRAR